jgi:hypothetical protein
MFLPASSLQPHHGAERIVDLDIDEIIDKARGFPSRGFRQFSRLNPKP